MTSAASKSAADDADYKTLAEKFEPRNKVSALNEDMSSGDVYSGLDAKEAANALDREATLRNRSSGSLREDEQPKPQTMDESGYVHLSPPVRLPRPRSTEEGYTQVRSTRRLSSDSTTLPPEPAEPAPNLVQTLPRPDERPRPHSPDAVSKMQPPARFASFASDSSDDVQRRTSIQEVLANRAQSDASAHGRPQGTLSLEPLAENSYVTLFSEPRQGLNGELEAPDDVRLTVSSVSEI